jgi:hypothetical protein
MTTVHYIDSHCLHHSYINLSPRSCFFLHYYQAGLFKLSPILFLSQLKALSLTKRQFNDFTNSQSQRFDLIFPLETPNHNNIRSNMFYAGTTHPIIRPRCAHERLFARTRLLPYYAFCTDGRHSSHERFTYGLWRVWRGIWIWRIWGIIMAEGMRRIHLLIINNLPSSFLRRRGVEGGTGTDTDSSGISEDVIY